MADETTKDAPRTTRVRMNTTVASGTTVWEQGAEYDMDAELARAWIRDRVASEPGDVKSPEEVRDEVVDDRIPRASEVDAANLTGVPVGGGGDVPPTFDASKATRDELVAEAKRLDLTVKRADGQDGEPLVSDYRAALAG